MKIRRAKEGDLLEIAKLYKESYSEKPYNEKWIDKNVSARLGDLFSWTKIYVVVIDKKIIGFIIFYSFLWDTCNKGYIEDLGVDKKYRNKGIAKKLMEKAEIELKKLGVKKILLDVNIKSLAINLYKKIDYIKTDYIKMEKKI